MTGLMPSVVRQLRQIGVVNKDRRCYGERLTGHADVFADALGDKKMILRAVRKHPMGQIEVHDLEDAARGIAMILEYYPTAKALLPVSSHDLAENSRKTSGKRRRGEDANEKLRALKEPAAQLSHTQSCGESTAAIGICSCSPTPTAQRVVKRWTVSRTFGVELQDRRRPIGADRRGHARLRVRRSPNDNEQVAEVAAGGDQRLQDHRNAPAARRREVLAPPNAIVPKSRRDGRPNLQATHVLAKRPAQ